MDWEVHFFSLKHKNIKNTWLHRFTNSLILCLKVSIILFSIGSHFFLILWIVLYKLSSVDDIILPNQKGIIDGFEQAVLELLDNNEMDWEVHFLVL